MTVVQSRKWLGYFRDHQLCQPKWHEITPDGNTAIVLDSIKEFQLGERSEGTHLQARADHYAQSSGDQAYAACVKHLIREENHHAFLLERYLIGIGAEVAQKSALSWAFRILRRGLNLEWTISVLVTAEILAMTYYRALLTATGCPCLRSICAAILADEEAHIAFQMQHLHALRGGQAGRLNNLMQVFHSIFYYSTACALWLRHRRALSCGGFTLFPYFRQVTLEWVRARRHQAAEPPQSVLGCDPERVTVASLKV